MYKLFMNFDDPTEALSGKRESVQGFAICENLGFVLFHTGICAVYDLASKHPSPISTAKLGSYNPGIPDKRYANHANDAMFGNKLPGEEFPLLYVTAGNSGECDEHGYIACCAVEQPRLENGELTFSTVQRIYYNNEGDRESEIPGWGWPASLVDVEGGAYYLFSAKCRTTKAFAHLDNEYIVTKFALPDPTAGDVTLTRADALERFTLPFDVFFTQGGTLRDRKIYYTFGCGNADYPNELLVIDLDKREIILREPISCASEVECSAFFGDRLLINTQSREIFERT